MPFCAQTQQQGRESGQVSDRRRKIRLLNARDDSHGMFDSQDGVGLSAEHADDDGTAFRPMLEDTLSGADQAEIIRQKYPEPYEPGSEKHRACFQGRAQAELDLHGCHVSEALVRVDSFIETSTLQGLDAVRIIVGKGLHSQGAAVLPDAVEEKIVALKRAGRVATFTWEKKRKRSSGSLLVYLK
jgi:DNA-nicking Smr family endonuclease